MTALESPWLDKKIMEQWLKTPVLEIHSENGSAKGENYLSSMVRLVVKTKNGKTFNLVVKCRIEEGAVADAFRNTDIFKKEEEMYLNTAPRLSKIIREKFPDVEDFAPKCYYACDTFMVLEDLSAAGFKNGDRKVGLNLNQCLLVMRTLARFHAASAILIQRDPNAFKKYDVNFFSEPNLQIPLSNWCTGMAKTFALELESASEKSHSYAEKLGLLADDMLNRVRDLAASRDGVFNVLTHGDLWTNNIMIKGETSGIRFVDFQLLYYGSPAIDIQYFIVSSATLEVRKNHINDMIQEYHDTLCDTLTVLGYEGELITLEQLRAEVDRKVLYGLFTLVAPYAVMQCSTECGFSLDESFETGRNPGPCMYGELYKKAAKFLVPIFERKGAFEN